MHNLTWVVPRSVATVATVVGVVVSCALAPGCSGSSSAPGGVASGPGESCTRTADCQAGLLCVANVCGAASGADAGPARAPGADGGADGAVEASAPAAGPSGIGEACQTSRDCKAGLECVPATGGGAVCDLASFGLTPGTKTCTGECSTAADCCELPPGVSVYAYLDGGYVYAQNCTDIFAGILGGSTAACVGSASPYSTPTNACFLYETYCSCVPGTWACNGGRCQYTAPCHNQYSNELGGCPAQTRTGTTLDTACNLTTGTCATSACSVSSDCDGLPVIDRTTTTVTCRAGDCTCVAGGCYLKCTADIDCDAGYACDTTRSVCAPAPCTSDAQCFSQLGMARARCSGGKCGVPCAVDLDCSPSGDLPGQPFNGTVCGPGGTCEPVGCTSNGDCSRTGTAAKKFCVASAGSVRSAVTN